MLSTVTQKQEVAMDALAGLKRREAERSEADRSARPASAAPPNPEVRAKAPPPSSRKLGRHAVRNGPPIGQPEDGTTEQSPLYQDQCSSDLAPYRRCIDHRPALSPLDRPIRLVVLPQRAPCETG